MRNMLLLFLAGLPLAARAAGGAATGYETLVRNPDGSSTLTAPFLRTPEGRLPLGSASSLSGVCRLYGFGAPSGTVVVAKGARAVAVLDASGRLQDRSEGFALAQVTCAPAPAGRLSSSRAWAQLSAPQSVAVYAAPKSGRFALALEAGLAPNKRGGSLVAGVGGFQHIERGAKDAAGRWPERRFSSLGPTLGYRQPFLRAEGGDGALELSAALGWAPLSWTRAGVKADTGKWHYITDGDGDVIGKESVDSWVSGDSEFLPLTGYASLAASYRFKKSGVAVGLERRVYQSLQSPKDKLVTLGLTLTSPLRSPRK